jgi:cytochrome P450
MIKWLSATLFSAASHTTVASLCNFIIAMVKYPEAARKAREEIDRVVGRGRLPGMADREKLVYVECLIREVLRWRNVTPLGTSELRFFCKPFRLT